MRDVAHNQSSVSTKLSPMQGRVLGGIMLVLLAFAPLLLNAFGGGGLLSSLVIAGIFYIALLGLDVMMGYCGQVSLGHAAFMAMGGYTAAICCVKFGLPPIVGVLLRPRRLADLRDGALAGHGPAARSLHGARDALVRAC